MIQLIDDWFVRFKVTASEGSRAARGRLDPRTQMSLFKAETKDAVEECKKKSQYVSDPLPLQDMYLTIPPNPNSKHELPQHLSRRVESKLESFHDNLSHFANCGMRSSLCDNLNLCGAARYNLTIRHKLALTHENPQKPDAASRKDTPGGWEDVVPYFNHSELGYINTLAKGAGSNHVPFENVETLVKDTGERFFSEHIVKVNPIKQQHDTSNRCLCGMCRDVVPTPSRPQQINDQSTNQTPNTVATTTTTTATQTPAKTDSDSNSPQLTRNNPQFTRQTSGPESVKQRPTITMLPHPQQQQQPHQQVIHQHHGAAFYAPTVPMMMPFVFPCPWMAPPTTATQHAMLCSAAASCCSRHRSWAIQPNRVGRPPHDAHCHCRSKSKSKSADDKECKN